MPGFFWKTEGGQTERSSQTFGRSTGSGESNVSRCRQLTKYGKIVAGDYSFTEWADTQNGTGPSGALKADTQALSLLTGMNAAEAAEHLRDDLSYVSGPSHSSEFEEDMIYTPSGWWSLEQYTGSGYDPECN